MATRCLTALADINQNIIFAKISTDDLITGTETLNKHCSNINYILLSAGFRLRKWCNNISVNVSTHSNSECAAINNQNDGIKTLGISWNPTLDTMQFSFDNLDLPDKISKRRILSSTTKIFDPVELLSPITVVPKLIIQFFWKLNLNGDRPVLENIALEWQNFEGQLCEYL